jgi:glycosyltransferase involved in cell wall biosynthesis
MPERGWPDDARMHGPDVVMGNEPLVTIGVPVRNGEDMLAEALDSALAQEYPNLEILISDNASVDATPEICRRYAEADPRIRWWRNDQNIGFGLNFALTAERARGEYFTWLAHDDLLSPGYLSVVIAYMAPRPDVLLCTTSLNLLGLEGPGVLTPMRLVDFYDGVNWAETRRRVFRTGHPMTPYLLYGVFRRAAMPDLRRLVVDLPSNDLVSSFSELWVLTAVAVRGRIVALPPILRTYRVHDGSASTRFMDALPRQLWARVLRSRMRILRQAFDAPLPWPERLPLAVAAARNFLVLLRRSSADPRRVIKQLRREIAMLRRTCDERLAVIERLDAECRARQRLIDELRAKSSATR